MRFSELLYDAAMHAARPLATIASPLSTKLRAGVLGRRSAQERLLDWAQTERSAGRSLVWMHAPSVGESLMAQAIITELRALVPDVQIVFTHFSPSAERIALNVGADAAAFLPWDTRSGMERLVSSLRPSAIGFVRTEIWPGLVRAAARRNVRTALVNAALSYRSSRLRGTARWLLGPAYRQLDRIGAIATSDAERFGKLGVDAGRVSVTGDARFDQVHARIQSLDLDQPLLRRLRDDRVITIVAGSTWPTDEAEIIPAFGSARRGSPLRLIIAPHEPTPGHVKAVQDRLSRHGVTHARLSEIETSSAPLPHAIVVDRVGVLADLYSCAMVAYVGGGFHGAGLHSVIEPAALGVPVVFGPRHGNAREADELAGKGGGFVASDGITFASIVLDLAGREVHRKTASSAARAYVQSRLGGARRNAQLLADFLI